MRRLCQLRPWLWASLLDLPHAPQNIWDVNTRRLLYKLPGHKGSVNDVAFHPKEPIVASCSSDHTIYLGEIST